MPISRVAEARRRWALRRDMGALWDVPPPEAWAAFGASHIVPPVRVSNPQLISIGDRVLVHEDLWFSVVRHFRERDVRLVIEDDVRIGRGCQISVAGEVTIGRGAIVGDFVQIGDTVHPFESERRLDELVEPAPVRIGPGAIVGGHATIAPGVTIGAGAYVEHHSVVGRDVGAGDVVAGNPARTVA